MQNIDTKTTGDSLTAIEFNNIPDELENAITSTGITLSGADPTQLTQAMSVYAAGGAFYTDTGSSTLYDLSAVGSKLAPPDYFNGMSVSFVAGNSNSTATPSINVAGLGAKNIVVSTGVPLEVGDIPTSGVTTLYYDGTEFTYPDAVINRAPKSYKTVASMVADLSLAVGQGVELTGYHSDGDGGGKKGTVVAPATGTDDGGFYHDLDNSNQFQMAPDATVTVEAFGAVGNFVPGPDTGDNDYDAFIACFAALGVCRLRARNYKYGGTGVVPRLTSSLVIEGVSPASFVYSNTESQIHVTTPEVPFFMGSTDVASVELRNFAMVCNKSGPAHDTPSFTAVNMDTCDFAMFGVHLRGNIDSTQASDPNVNTDNLITSALAAESAKTITDFSPYETWRDIDTRHGTGLMLTKSVDALMSKSFISGFGCGLNNWGADMTTLSEMRITSNAVNVYDKFLGTGVGDSWGSQLRIKDSETLYNLRAPNFLFDDSRYIEIDNVYYEVISQSGVFIASNFSNYKVTDTRLDGIQRSSGTTNPTDQPFMLVDNYSEGTLLKDNFYAQFLSGTPKATAPIRFINTQTGFLHKRNAFVIGRQKTVIFPTPDFSDGTNATNIVNFRKDEPAQNILCPTNVFEGVGVEHEASVFNSKLVFYDGTAGKFFTAQMPLNKYQGTLNINILAQANAAATAIFFVIDLIDNTGRTIQSVQNANLGGFIDSAYQVVTKTYDLDAVDISGATKVAIAFGTDGGYVASIDLS